MTCLTTIDYSSLVQVKAMVLISYITCSKCTEIKPIALSPAGSACPVCLRRLKHTSPLR